MRSHITIDVPIQRFATNWRPGDVSGAVNLAIGRYQNVIAKSVPEFYPEEWRLTFDALRGSVLDDPGIQDLWLYVDDACHEHGLGEKWGVDAEKLTARLQALTYPELVAVAELTELFWRTDMRGGQSNEAIISQLIADIQDPQ